MMSHKHISTPIKPQRYHIKSQGHLERPPSPFVSNRSQTSHGVKNKDNTITRASDKNISVSRELNAARNQVQGESQRFSKIQKGCILNKRSAKILPNNNFYSAQRQQSLRRSNIRDRRAQAYQTSTSMSIDPIQQLEHQNSNLRTKLLDCQFKEREMMMRINNLEQKRVDLQQMCLKLQKSPGKGSSRQHKNEEDKFIKVVKTTFEECFGVRDLKDIWKIQKEILRAYIEQDDYELKIVRK